MDFRVEQRFGAPLAVVEAALLDPRFVERLGTLPRLGRPELLRQEQDGRLVHREVRHAFVGELSPAVTAVIERAKLTWVDVATHDLDTHRSEHRVVPDHYGTRLTCRYTTVLAPSAQGTERTTEGELHVHMPLVGGRVERAVVSGLVEHAEGEAAALRAWLAEGAGRAEQA